MMQSPEETHLVYLLTRKSDSQQYVGITIKRRLKQRLGDHKRSNRFKNDDFDFKVLEESQDRQYIEDREEYYINEYDTFNSGLNDTSSGKGYGHNSKNFTTLGYIFTEEQRENMSIAAKNRAKNEPSGLRAEKSKKLWEDPEYRKKQEGKRKGKRLRPPKISDEEVAVIRNHFESVKNDYIAKAEAINLERHKRNPSWKKTTPERAFAKDFHEHYNLSDKGLYGIVAYKTRTEVLPDLWKS